MTTQSLFHFIYSHQTFINIHNAKQALSNTINVQTAASSQSSIYPWTFAQTPHVHTCSLTVVETNAGRGWCSVMGRGRVSSPRKKSAAVKTLASSSRTCDPPLLVCASLHLLLLRHHLHPSLLVGGGLLPSRSSETDFRGRWDRENDKVRRRLALILLSTSPNPRVVQRRPQSPTARSRGGEEFGGRALGSGGRQGEEAPRASPAEHLPQSPRGAAPTAVAGGEKQGRRGGRRRGGAVAQGDGGGDGRDARGEEDAARPGGCKQMGRV